MENVKVIIDADNYNALVDFRNRVMSGKKIQITGKGYSIIDPEQALDCMQEHFADLEDKMCTLTDKHQQVLGAIKKLSWRQFRKWRKQP